jgi:hypothetical protein
MWPLGRELLFQFAVVWQRLQSFGAAIVLDVWSAGRNCITGLAAPMVYGPPPAASWQVLQVVGTKACLA